MTSAVHYWAGDAGGYSRGDGAVLGRDIGLMAIQLVRRWGDAVILTGTRSSRLAWPPARRESSSTAGRPISRRGDDATDGKARSRSDCAVATRRSTSP